MALKFLNKKGWHTGSLRNIENVWKAEQKHEVEKRKLEELKKQIQDEREAQEFRLLQEQAGLIPKQERLEFLYDSGLSVGHSTVQSSTEDYLLGKPVEEKKEENVVAKVAATPGSLFVEEKPYSANDAWRKLHTDPLLLIRQQEQAALARIRNNPVKMDLIKKSIKENLGKKRKHKDKKEKKHKEKKRKHSHSYESEDNHKVKGTEDNLYIGDSSRADKQSSHRIRHGSPSRRYEGSQRSYGSPQRRRHNSRERRYEGREQAHDSPNRGHDVLEKDHRDSRQTISKGRHDRGNNRHDSPDSLEAERTNSHSERRHRKEDSPRIQARNNDYSNDMSASRQKLEQPRRKLTDEERAARLKEMQQDAEMHEEQRWHRLKKASDADRLEEARRHSSNGKNFMYQTSRSIYGAEKGGSASVEESVRRRAHFIERSIGDSNANTFQRL